MTSRARPRAELPRRPTQIHAGSAHFLAVTVLRVAQMRFVEVTRRDVLLAGIAMVRDGRLLLAAYAYLLLRPFGCVI